MMLSDDELRRMFLSERSGSFCGHGFYPYDAEWVLAGMARELLELRNQRITASQLLELRKLNDEHLNAIASGEVHTIVERERCAAIAESYAASHSRVSDTRNDAANIAMEIRGGCE